MNKRYLLTVLLVSLVIRMLVAQVLTANNGLALHLDKPFYVVGDVLRYQLYLPPGFAGREIALKMALKDAQGESLGAFYQQTGGATTLDGYLKIPYDLASANYHFLILGTDRTSLQKVKLAEIIVPIYNDLVEELPATKQGVASNAITAGANELQLSIELAAGPFHKREDILAMIKVADNEGNPVAADLSVSVIDAGLFGTAPNGWHQSPKAGAYIAADLSEHLYLNGQITGNNGAPRAAINFGAYIHELRESLLGLTDEAGNFALQLPTLTGPANIQFIDLRSDSLRVVLDDRIELGPTPALPFNEEIENYLKWSRSRKVIYQLYNTLETNLEQNRPPRKFKSLEPDQRILRSEYPNFKDLATFFIEVGTPLKFRPDKNGGYTAQMFNPNPRMRAFYQGNPIFLVDGKMTRNIDYIQQLELIKIDTIDLYFDFFNLNTYFGKLGNSGIAELKTSIPNLRVPAADEAAIFPIQGLLPEAREVLPEEQPATQAAFRANLFWAADQRTGSSGQTQIKFSQSDDLGTFLIQVAARSADGRMGIVHKTYEVQW